MIKKFISVTSHALYPLPLTKTVTPSRTPSPSTEKYFMDDPCVFYQCFTLILVNVFFICECFVSFCYQLVVKYFVVSRSISFFKYLYFSIVTHALGNA